MPMISISRYGLAQFASVLVGITLAALQAAAEERSAQGHSHDTGQHGAGHTLGVFIGDTTENRRTGLTLGLEYEYRRSPRVGIGLTVEHAAGDIEADVFVVPIAYHSGPWKFYAGPGIEAGEEGEEPLLRVGVEYGLHWGEIEVSPQIDFDFVDGERLFVIGVVFAREL